MYQDYMVTFDIDSIGKWRFIVLTWYHGGGSTDKILENHVQENRGWISFKTSIFYIFFDNGNLNEKYPKPP